MPRIRDEILGCVVYLYNSEERAREGDVKGARGTGFLASSRLEDAPTDLPQKQQLYVVTAGHVIEDDGSTVMRLHELASPWGGVASTKILVTDASEWVMHPAGDDVAACAIQVGHDPVDPWRYSYVRREKFIRHPGGGQPYEGGPYATGPGDDVFMVGRFINHEGRERNLPVVRFGTIAMMPHEPIRQTTRRNFDQDSFLVECRSVTGFSGSPVFVYMPSNPSQPKKPQRAGPAERGLLSRDVDVRLLGLDWGHIEHEIPNSQNILVPVNTGMSGVVPAWKIGELFDTEVFVRGRREAVRLLVEARDKGGARFD